METSVVKEKTSPGPISMSRPELVGDKIQILIFTSPGRIGRPVLLDLTRSIEMARDLLQCVQVALTNPTQT